MTALREAGGNIIRNPEEIVCAQCKFYKTYILQIYLLGMDLQEQGQIKISLTDRNWLDEPITKDELARALKETKRGKSPGPDGILAE